MKESLIHADVPRFVSIGGEIVPSAEATISIFDRGLLFGDGIYETVRVYNDEIFRWPGHWRRLQQSADRTYLPIDLSSDELEALCRKTWQANGLRDSYLRVTITRGVGVPGGIGGQIAGPPTVIVVARPASPYPEEWYAEGVKLIVSDVIRNHPRAQNPGIKATSQLNNVLCRIEAERMGAFDGLMLNADGNAAECSVANFFFVRDEEVATPSLDCGILEGVTRSAILEIARESGLSVSEGEFTAEEILHADEAFITSSTMELVPVRSLNDRTIGSLAPGKVTNILMSKLRDLIEKETN